MDDEQLWDAYAWPDHCLRVNFVVTIDGHTRGAHGVSGSLSDEEDRRIFHMQRAGCDAVLVGAGTVRAEKYGPVHVKPQWRSYRAQDTDPALVIVSASGNVPDIPGAQVVDGSDLSALKAQYPRILCEGGPHLFASLLGQDLVDELSLTIGGQFGGTGHLLPASVHRRATVRHIHDTAGDVFTLWDLH